MVRVATGAKLIVSRGVDTGIDSGPARYDYQGYTGSCDEEERKFGNLAHVVNSSPKSARFTLALATPAMLA